MHLQVVHLIAMIATAIQGIDARALNSRAPQGLEIDTADPSEPLNPIIFHSIDEDGSLIPATTIDPNPKPTIHLRAPKGLGVGSADPNEPLNPITFHSVNDQGDLIPAITIDPSPQPTQ